MKKALVMSFCLIFGLWLVNGLVKAEEIDINTEISQLKTELENNGVSPEDIKTIEKPTMEMLKKGAKREDLRNTIVGFSKKGIKGKELKNSINAMNELVKDGEDPKTAGNIVSQAVHQAQAEGLKGKELANRVHEAVRKRKEERMRLRKQVREEKRKEERFQLQKQSQEEKRLEQEGKKGLGKGKGEGK